MAHTEILRDVPAESLDEVVADYKEEGAEVTTTPQPNGMFTVTAIFPDNSPLAELADRHGALDVALMTFRQPKNPQGDDQRV
jgi:hypothetical protein